MDNSIKRRQFVQYSASTALYMSGLITGAYACRRSREDSGGSPPEEGSKKKLGIALVGLGQYSEEELAPALQETKLCRLAGIVTGTPGKIAKWQRKYGILDKNVYSYDNFDRIADNPDIDIVYVVLPNAMHKEYTIRAAEAGKHVICEKPMAVSVAEGEAMIRACREAGRMLSVGYRMHFEPATALIRQFRKDQPFGAFTTITASDSRKLQAGQWRLDKRLAGGGPLMDLGIYCVQACLYTTGELPRIVKASFGEKEDPEKFSSVEQSVLFDLVFPSGLIAHCHTSYAVEENQLRVECKNGWFEFSPAFAYRGIKGDSSEGKITLPELNQQAVQMDDFARCIHEGTPSKVSGEMGLRDLKILTAIYDAAETGREVRLDLPS